MSVATDTPDVKQASRTKDTILRYVEAMSSLQKVAADCRERPIRPTRRNPHRIPLHVALQKLDTLMILADTPEAQAFADRILPALDFDWRFDV